MALTQKLSLRRKTVETPNEAAPAKQPESVDVEQPELFDQQKIARPAVAKKLAPTTKLAPRPAETASDEDVVDAEVVEEQPTVQAKSRKLAAVPTAKITDEDDSVGSESAVVSYRPMAMGQIDGAISERDLMRPRINMVQSNSSDLESKGFTIGQIVLNGEVLVWDKGYDPLNVILMTGRKKFIQRLTDEEYKDGTMPMIFDSPKDAENAGFTVNWVGNEPPTADPGLFCLFLLEQPAYIEPDPIFSLEYGERKFCLAEMKFTGVNYRSSTAARWLMTQAQTSLLPDTRGYMLGLSCNREKQKSGNIVTVASFKNLGRHKDPKFVEWIVSLG